MLSSNDATVPPVQQNCRHEFSLAKRDSCTLCVVRALAHCQSVAFPIRV